jgi:hypothetical protein
MAQREPTVAQRSSLRGDWRIIVLGTWAFLLQIVCSWRLTRQLLEPHDDEHDS